MKTLKCYFLCGMLALFLVVSGCNNGSGGSVHSGTVAVYVTDAKPLLPDSVTNLFIEFSEVWVHKSGEGWIPLTLMESPYTIDLLQYYDGSTTQLVPPFELEPGHYTQMRIVVNKAMIRFEQDDTTDQLVDIPSQYLKTDKNFTIDIDSQTALDIVIHFDLSRSIVVSGPAHDPSYKLQPVLHLFSDPLQAVTFEGRIDNVSFGDTAKATLVVMAESNGEVYTEVEVSKSTIEGATETEVSIFWIAPDQTYTVRVNLDQNDTFECTELVEDFFLPEGAVFELNAGMAIENGVGICAP